MKEIKKMLWQSVEAGEKPINVDLLWGGYNSSLHSDYKNWALQIAGRRVF